MAPPKSEADNAVDSSSDKSGAAVDAVKPGGGLDNFRVEYSSKDSNPRPVSDAKAGASNLTFDSPYENGILPSSTQAALGKAAETSAAKPVRDGTGRGTYSGSMLSSASAAVSDARAAAQANKPVASGDIKPTSITGSNYPSTDVKPGGGNPAKISNSGRAFENASNAEPVNSGEVPRPPKGSAREAAADAVNQPKRAGGGGELVPGNDGKHKPGGGGDEGAGGDGNNKPSHDGAAPGAEKASDTSRSIIERNAAGELNKVIDAKGNETNFVRNKDGKITTTTDKNGVVQEFATKVKDANGNVTEHLRDGAGNRVDYEKDGTKKITAPDGSITHKRLDGSEYETGKNGVTKLTKPPVENANSTEAPVKPVNSKAPNEAGGGSAGDKLMSNALNERQESTKSEQASNAAGDANSSRQGDKSESMSETIKKYSDMVNKMGSLLPSKLGADSSGANRIETAKPPSPVADKAPQKIPIVTELKAPVPKPSK